MKTSVPIKVAIGYAIIIAIFTMAAWMVYANTRTFMRINQPNGRLCNGATSSTVWCIVSCR